MLYEVALIEEPTAQEKERGAVEKLILPPTAVIAADDRSAAVAAVMQNKDKISCNMNMVKVLCRPFGQ